MAGRAVRWVATKSRRPAPVNSWLGVADGVFQYFSEFCIVCIGLARLWLLIEMCCLLLMKDCRIPHKIAHPLEADFLDEEQGRNAERRVYGKVSMRSPQSIYVYMYTTCFLVLFRCKSFVPRWYATCLLYTSPSPRDRQKSRMPSSA